MGGLLTRMKRVQKGNSITGTIQCLVFVLGILFVTGHFCSVQVKADTPTVELLINEDMGSLNEGYSKADAKALSQEIKVRNNGESAIIISKSDLSISGSVNAFRLVNSIEEDTVTINPDQESIVGSIRPAHQMKKGRYDTQVNIKYTDEEENTNRISVSTGYTVLGSGISMDVTTEDADDDDCYFHDQTVGNIMNPEEFHYTVFNNGQCDFTLDVSSDSDIFKVQYDKAPVKIGESTEVTISLNVKKANTLDPGAYWGNILLAARGVEDGESTEIWVSAAIDILDLPGWDVNEINYERGLEDPVKGELLYAANATFADDTSGFLRAELVEGKEFFTMSDSRYNWGRYSIEEKEDLPAGVYTAKVRLLYDATGKGYFDRAQNLGDCTCKLIIRDYSKYNLKPDSVGNLGYLPEGYTQEEADALMKNLVLKNTGTESLNVSPSGAIFGEKDYFDKNDAFVLSKGGETTSLKPGESYDGAWVKPVVGLSEGSYYTHIYFQDEDDKTKTSSIPVYFTVVKKGFIYNVSNYGVEIGEKGLDLGFVQVGDKKEIRKTITIVNDGSVPFTVTASIPDSAGGVFGCSRYYDSSSQTEGVDSVVEPDDGIYLYAVCNPESIADKPEKYQGMLTLTIVSNENENDKATLNIPLTVEVTENAKVTLDLQGKGGDECQNVTMEFQKGTSYASALKKLVARATGQQEDASTVDKPTDDNYTVIGYTRKKELTDWEDLKTAQKEISSGYISEDTTIYVNWAKKIGDVNLTVDAPEDGEIIGDPVVTLPEGAHFTVSDDTDKTYWYRDKGEEVFTGERDYFARIRLVPEFGYAFSSSRDYTVKINNVKATLVSSSSVMDFLDVRASLRAGDHRYGPFQPIGEKYHKKTCRKCKNVVKEEHKFDQGKVTKKAACEQPGEITYTCSECGYEKYEEIAPAGHRYKKTIERMATDEEHGLATYTCIDCDNSINEDFYYTCKDAADTWYKNSEASFSATFERTPYLDAGVKDDKNSFTGIKIDGKEVPAENYEATVSNEISTAITVSAGRMKILDVGEHTLTCLYKDGEATARFKVEEAREEKDVTPGGKDNTPAATTEKSNNTVPADTTVKEGSHFQISGSTYKVISAKKKTVSLVKALKTKKTFVLPASVKIKDGKYKVTSIAKVAFKGTKVKTLTVKTKKLTKKSVKGSLKGSKVKTIKVKTGKKSLNKKYVKKYAKIFTKKNAGRKVTVK